MCAPVEKVRCTCFKNPSDTVCRRSPHARFRLVIQYRLRANRISATRPLFDFGIAKSTATDFERRRDIKGGNLRTKLSGRISRCKVRSIERFSIFLFGTFFLRPHRHCEALDLSSSSFPPLVKDSLLHETKQGGPQAYRSMGPL
jgi:hypothetical protein